MLLTTTEAAELLRTTPTAARGVLDRLRVKPVNLGHGRGLGLRWYKSEILDALDNSRKPLEPRQALQDRPSCFRGRSAGQIVAELTGGQQKR